MWRWMERTFPRPRLMLGAFLALVVVVVVLAVSTSRNNSEAPDAVQACVDAGRIADLTRCVEDAGP